MIKKNPFGLFYFLLAVVLASLALPQRAGAQVFEKRSRLFIGSFTVKELAADNAGNTYTLAVTTSNTFPITIGDAATGTGSKSVLVKHDAEGNILWARYLPLSSTGAGNSIFQTMVLDNGMLYMLGGTTASDVSVTNGSVFGGVSDVLYARVNDAGALLTSAYLGGNGTDDGAGMALKIDNGNIYITYTTTSSDIVTTTGPAFTSGYDHVVMKMDPSGNVGYTTYTGSASSTVTNTDIVSLAVNNGVAVLGLSVSSANNFTTTDGSSVSGAYDFGLVSLDANGNKVFARVYGGTGDEYSPVVAMNGTDIFISGYSTSPNYPVTDGSSFSGTDRRHVLTKFGNTGAVLFSSNQAGVTNTADTPLMQVKDGYVYVMGSSQSSVPAMNQTDATYSGTNYLIKLNAVSCQVQFAISFGGIRVYANARGTAFTVADDGKIYTAAPSLNANPSTTDGSAKTGQGGVFVTGFTPDGKIFLLTAKANGAFVGSSTLSLATSPGKLFIAIAAVSSSSAYIPVTEPTAAPGTTSTPLAWMVFDVCPPMPVNNVIAPLTQTVCKEGFTQSLIGDKVAFSSANMPVPVKGALTYPQLEIQARYQWQTAASATGPWTDIPGVGIQKDYTPPATSANRYYRRLTLPPLSCGNSPVSISDVAEVLVSSDVAPTVSAGIYNTCVGTPVDVTVNVTGGATPYAFTWDQGISSTIESATVTPAGNSVYTVTVTDNAGCKQNGQVIVNAYQADAGAVSVASCSGSPVRIGTPPPAGLAGVTYAWTPATGLDDATAAQPLASPTDTTVYTVSMTVPVTGGGTCTTTDNITVNTIDAPTTANFAGPDVAVCKGGTLALGTTAESGFGYTWAPGNYLDAVSGSTTLFNAGSEQPQPNSFTYHLTAAKGGCTFTDDVTVSVLEADAGEDLCGPRTVGVGDKIPNVVGKTYLWEKVSGPGSITGTTDTPVTTVSASVGGSSTYQLTVSYLGVSCTDQVVVPECSAGVGCPVVEIAVDAENGCPSTAFGSVTLRADPATISPARWTYTWSASPSGGISATTGTAITLTDNIERDVTLTMVSVDNPSFTCSKTIHVNGPSWSKPTFVAQDAVLCPGTSVSIGQTPVAGYSYNWKTLSGGDAIISNPSVTPLGTASYPVVVTDDLSGCITRDTAVVTVKALVVDPGPDWTACSNALIQLGSTAKPGYTYSWNPAVASYQDGTDYTSAEPRVLVAVSQDFILTATDTETGCSNDSTVHITIDNSATLPGLQDTAICKGLSAVIGPKALPGVTYSWLPATGLSDAAIAQPTANPAATTVYTVTATYYDVAGNPTCSKSGTVTVTVNAPVITLSDASVCPSDALYNLGTGVTVSPDATGFAWSPAALVTNASILNTTVRANVNTSTIFTLKATDANGCSTVATKTVSPTIASPLAGSNALVCVGSSIVLGDETNDDDGSTLSWSVTPALAGTLSSAASPAPVFTPAAGDAGKTFVFTVSKTVAGCTGTSKVSVVVKQFSLPNMAAQTVCSNSAATIGVAASAGVSYVWSPATDLTNPNASSTIVSPVTDTRTYTLTAIDNNGCVATGKAVIGVNATPAPAVSIPDVTVTVGNQPQQFNPVISPAGTYTYSWTPADKVDNPYIENARPLAGSVGNTNYTLTVTNENGCTSVAQTQLKVVQSVTLPVTLSAFKLQLHDCDVRLSWKVETADHFSRFIIERSRDGIYYTQTGSVSYRMGQSDYSFADGTPGTGNWFYRMKLVDQDGRYTYSRVLSTGRMVCGQVQSRLVIYPNPAQTQVNITCNKPVDRVIVLSAQGQVVMQKSIAASQAGTIVLPLDGRMRAGLYFLQVVYTDGTVQYSKLIKE